MEGADDTLSKNLIILCVFVGVVAVTAEVDWAATMHGCRIWRTLFDEAVDENTCGGQNL